MQSKQNFLQSKISQKKAKKILPTTFIDGKINSHTKPKTAN